MDRRLKVGGILLYLMAIGGVILASMLAYSAFHAEKIWWAALMIFGALELLITSIFTFMVGRVFIYGLDDSDLHEEYDDIEGEEE